MRQSTATLRWLKYTETTSYCEEHRMLHLQFLVVECIMTLFKTLLWASCAGFCVTYHLLWTIKRELCCNILKNLFRTVCEKLSVEFAAANYYLLRPLTQIPSKETISPQIFIYFLLILTQTQMLTLKLIWTLTQALILTLKKSNWKIRAWIFRIFVLFSLTYRFSVKESLPIPNRSTRGVEIASCRCPGTNLGVSHSVECFQTRRRVWPARPVRSALMSAACSPAGARPSRSATDFTEEL